MVTVTSAELQKHFGKYREAAMREPVSITNHGRESLVLVSASEYQRLRRRDREVLRIEDLGEDFLRALERAEVPADQAHLDAELEGWTP
ncbi:MAG: type II toxin-antitoxin system Phd/YefM family antitoxin [Alphaproteobacteria bacterium]|nr:type II toxin-antitoxin system Phd/YefM family antitoxin [Alphaproteobacteria bacterium]